MLKSSCKSILKNGAVDRGLACGFFVFNLPVFVENSGKILIVGYPFTVAVGEAGKCLFVNSLNFIKVSVQVFLCASLAFNYDLP